MAKFLNTSKASAEIEEIISKTKNKVVLISPYIKIPELLLARLKYIDGKGIKIVVVCRKGDLKVDVRSDLKQLKGLELRFDENLHAKCFYNEESMVIGSLNLYDYSQQNNREMGILLSLKDDQNVFNEARNEAEFIVSNAEKDSLIRSVFSEVVKDAKSMVDTVVKDEPQRPKTGSYSYRTKTKQGGFCIRCGRNISYDLGKPLCPDCFSEWNIYKNPDYEEHCCHTCGKSETTTMAMPQCNRCYDRSRR